MCIYLSLGIGIRNLSTVNTCNWGREENELYTSDLRVMRVIGSDFRAAFATAFSHAGRCQRKGKKSFGPPVLNRHVLPVWDPLSLSSPPGIFVLAESKERKTNHRHGGRSYFISIRPCCFRFLWLLFVVRIFSPLIFCGRYLIFRVRGFHLWPDLDTTEAYD